MKKPENKSASMKASFAQMTEGMSSNEVAKLLFAQTPKFLKSDEWLSLRDRTMVRYGRVCMCCKKNAGIDACADHIKPRLYYPHLALDPENLQILCRKCNKQKGNKHATDYRPK